MGAGEQPGGNCDRDQARARCTTPCGQPAIIPDPGDDCARGRPYRFLGQRNTVVESGHGSSHGMHTLRERPSRSDRAVGESCRGWHASRAPRGPAGTSARRFGPQPIAWSLPCSGIGCPPEGRGNYRGGRGWGGLARACKRPCSAPAWRPRSRRIPGERHQAKQQTGSSSAPRRGVGRPSCPCSPCQRSRRR